MAEEFANSRWLDYTLNVATGRTHVTSWHDMRYSRGAEEDLSLQRVCLMEWEAMRRKMTVTGN